MLLTGKATEHDVTPAYLADAGVKIIRHIHSYAYARNGNAHNPTPNYKWRVYLNGKLETEEYTSARAKIAALDVLQDAGRAVPAQLQKAVKKAEWLQSLKPPPRF